MPLSPPMLALFAAAAFLYAMVGHGGGSAYLAIMGMSEWPQDDMRVTALSLNIAVAGIAWIAFLSRGSFRWKLWAYCAAGGVPAAWLGGGIAAPAPLFWTLVGLALLVTAYLMAFPGEPENHTARVEAPSDPGSPHSKIRVSPLWVPVGAALGFIAGACGIGGGVFLGPALILTGAATPFESAGVSAAYIFVNSAAGLASARWPQDWQPSPVLLAAVVVAGAAGARFGAHRATPLLLRRALSAALAVAAVKCLLNAR